MVAAWVGGELSDQRAAAENGDVFAVADDVAFVSGPAQPDADAVGRDVDVA